MRRMCKLMHKRKAYPMAASEQGPDLDTCTTIIYLSNFSGAVLQFGIGPLNCPADPWSAGQQQQSYRNKP